MLARALRLLTKRTILFCPQHSGSVVILLPPLLDGFIYSAIAWLWLFRRQAQLPAFAPTAPPGPKGAVLRAGAAWGAWPGSFGVPSGLCSTGRRHLEQMLAWGPPKGPPMAAVTFSPRNANPPRADGLPA